VTVITTGTGVRGGVTSSVDVEVTVSVLVVVVVAVEVSVTEGEDSVGVEMTSVVDSAGVEMISVVVDSAGVETMSVVVDSAGVEMISVVDVEMALVVESLFAEVVALAEDVADSLAAEVVAFVGGKGASALMEHVPLFPSPPDGLFKGEPSVLGQGNVKLVIGNGQRKDWSSTVASNHPPHTVVSSDPGAPPRHRLATSTTIG
jgi:hypothetical protein